MGWSVDLDGVNDFIKVEIESFSDAEAYTDDDGHDFEKVNFIGLT